MLVVWVPVRVCRICGNSHRIDQIIQIMTSTEDPETMERCLNLLSLSSWLLLTWKVQEHILLYNELLHIYVF